MLVNIECPKCHESSNSKEWNETTKSYCRDEYITLIEDGYGKNTWLYHCPECGEFSSGRELKEYNSINV